MQNRTAIILALVGVALFSTNPTQDEYISWLKQQVSTEAGGGIDGALLSSFGGPLLNASTARKDFFVFSLYETKLIETKPTHAIGFLRHFSFIPNAKPRFSHVVEVGEDKWKPEDGYTWVVNPPVDGDLRVKWASGRLNSKYPHIISAETEGQWRPEDGYMWVVNPPVAGDMRVKWTSGQPSSKYPHIIASDIEGRWLPERGYAWVMSPPVAGDFRVKAIGAN
jgi:hypothetical protein